MKIRELGISRMFFIKLEPNDDILDSLTSAVNENSIRTGFFTVIGALKTAYMGYYLLDQKKYNPITLNGNFEIVSCSGNVTLKDGSPMIHAHLVIADKEGRAFGGHLLSGCRISVTGEVFLVEAEQILNRTLEEPFNLSLIKME